ncbi:hypothetical protein jhhlp_001510 [Lomentospora prolificans]|uniref:Uncharacterized protein n=1 Tax=Lomentospora prolificans TaxID=41688 RepID=A0A2N3NIH7_9PEZI|nr:hypothetical protein jhhlp_001510 [Lomentospora prolificans]
MTTEQGTGGGALGGSPPRPNTQNESLPETEVENCIPQQQDEAQPQYTEPLRHLDEPTAPASGKLTNTFSPACASSKHNRSSSSCLLYSRRISRPLEPPVTKVTLSELDVTKIIHNPKLRHDINFDPDLHFRPNLEGEKGRRKQERANLFWSALLEQLFEFVGDRPTFEAKHGRDDDWCLPALLKAVKEIIQTLVPQRDRVYLDEGLNVDLLMQQFNMGVADLEKLALWLSKVLKSHCAPMRDEWVDEMYNELSNGNRNNDMGQLVKGMKSLLSVLEAMKLDVANHQIRCLRPALIEDTVNFEQRFFLKKIAAGKIDVDTAKIWYRDACERYSSILSNPGITQAFGDMTIFFEGLARLLLPSVDEKTVPNTFLFDEERIMKLRSDLTDAINLEICMRAYEEMESGYGEHLLSSALQGLSEQLRPGSPDSVFSGCASASSSRPSSLVFSNAGSANSSQRSSLVLPTPTAADNARSKAKANDLYNSLVALLQTAPSAAKPGARWKAIAPSMALQVFRYTNAPQHALPALEANIASLINDVHCTKYRDLEEQFLAKLLNELAARVKQFRGLSGVSLFSIASGGRPNNGYGYQDREREEGSRESREDESIEDLAIRLAHLGIIHWRVWSGLVYSEDVEMTTELDQI